jgi:hypothetical protein
MRLRPKLLIAFLSLTMLPLGLLGVMLYRSTVLHTERLIGRRLKDNVLQAAEAIDGFMGDRVEDMRFFSQSAAFVGGRPSAISAQLGLDVTAHPFYSQLLYVGARGRVLAASDSASVGKQLLDLHPDLADEARGAAADAPGTLCGSAAKRPRPG